MKLVVFGLTISSSWGNGHATIWRGLCRALGQRGHDVVFFERNVPYYAEFRDLTEMPGGGQLRIYDTWADIQEDARRHLDEADVGIVTSYCFDGVAATDLALSSRVRIAAFYDLDTPVTLERLEAGETVPYIGPRGLADFDIVISYAGGTAVDGLKSRLGARRVATLYGSVDPQVHRRADLDGAFAADLSYLGTYAADRQATLEELLLEPARCLPEQRFLIGGAQYPESFPWGKNVYFVRHVDPRQHASFYSSCRLTLNVTRRAMRKTGYCPSGRLFEAAACRTPVVSDRWDGLHTFYEPGSEIIVAETADDVVDALRRQDLDAIGRRAQERTFSEHTADHRAAELESILSDVASGTDAETIHPNSETALP